MTKAATKSLPAAEVSKEILWAQMTTEFGTKFHGLRTRLALVAVGEAELDPLDAQMFARMKELGLR